MTVRELIEALKGMDPDRLVVLQKDGEGNGYSPLADVDDNAAYMPETTWSGEVGLQFLTAEDRSSGFSDEDLAHPNATPCVILGPTN